MNYEDFRTRYLTDINNDIASTTAYSLEEASNEIERIWSVGGGGSGLNWSNSAQSVTINASTTINQDLWDRLTTNTAQSIEYEPLSMYDNLRGRRAQRTVFDDSMWRKEFTFTLEEAVPSEEDTPLEQIADEDLEKLF